jgi:hypothetical protein
MNTISKMAAKLLLVVGLLVSGFAMAQSEPSMNQIYATAKAGKLDEAQVMVQQVLVTHPKSAKAHFVQAELYSRQGKLDLARQALASAEQYAPGLPFAKPEAVQALRTQLSAKPQKTAVTSYSAPQAPAISSGYSNASGSWLLPLLLAGGVTAAGFFFFRRRTPSPLGPQPAYAPQNNLSGPQTFGMAGGMQPGYPQPGYPQPGYPQGGYPQQAGTGLGGRIMGGVATGLAVGAGVMAAEAIGRNLMGGHNSTAAPTDTLAGNNGFEPLAAEPNLDMGGDNFGINDTAWDDAGGGDGTSDWDN